MIGDGGTRTPASCFRRKTESTARGNSKHLAPGFSEGIKKPKCYGPLEWGRRIPPRPESEARFPPVFGTEKILGSFLRLCSFFFVPAAFVPRPVPCCSFPASQLQLFLNALSLHVIVRRGD